MEELNDNSTNTENPSKRKSILIFFVILIALLCGGLVYMYLQTTKWQEQSEMTQEELDQAINELDSMSSELDNRILTIAQLGGEIDTLIQIKNQLEEEKKAFRQTAYRQINDLQGRVDGYKELLVNQDKEIERLKVLNEQLMSENTGLKNEANELNESIRNLNSDREALENKVAMASQLKIEGMKIMAVSTSGKERPDSFRNRHINELKIEFDIAENRVAPIEGKEILLKITAPDDNVIFDVASGSGTFIFEGRESFYTAKKEILYDRNAQSLTFMYIKGTDYDIGKYAVEVYTEDYLMGVGEFTVK